MEWMLMPLRRYADFRGRSRRMEFWMWVLFVVVVAIVLSIIDSALGLGGASRVTTSRDLAPGSYGAGASAFTRGGILTGIFSLAILIPNLAVSVRRLHDIDRTGWWIVLPAAPYIVGLLMIGAGMGTQSIGLIAAAGFAMLIGFILGVVLLVFYCLQGTRGPNRFGPDPLDPAGVQDLDEVFR